MAKFDHPPSTIHHSPFTIHHPPFTIHHPPSTIHHPPFTIHHPPSTIHHPPLSVNRSAIDWETCGCDCYDKAEDFRSSPTNLQLYLNLIWAMISNLSKFCQFCVVILVTAVITVLLLSPHPLKSSTESLVAGTIQLPDLQQIAPPTPELAWSETGATVLPLAAQIMLMRNPDSVELDLAQKGYLRPLFGNLVDRVGVVYGAKLLDRWSQGGKETHIGGVDSSAQTYCDRIYIRASYQPRDTDRLVLLAHELTHAQQCARAGGISQFGESYFKGYYRGGQTYQDNPLEKSARRMEERFTHKLCDAIGCPPRSGKYYVNYKGWGIKLPVNM